MGNTANFNLEYPEGSADVDIAQHIQNLAEDVDTQLSNVSQSLDTGWRQFPQQTLTLDFTGQAGTVWSVTPLWRRVANDIYIGGVVIRNTNWSGASGSLVNKAWAAPAGVDWGYGANISAAFYATNTVPTTSFQVTHITISVQSVDYGSGGTSLQLSVNPSTSFQIVPTGYACLVRSSSSRRTDADWPISLPGSPYTP